ncbi:hypothetical protein CK203_083889 [Vitis vinifera]|uniref:Uncharacterized protein n=1 Tax=Vitis vinifera TaxID=29760 RepID=A0A438BU80_VITVI|nr:hypothetical protein CK203_083889 [Vitis vinifera]
MDVSLESKSLPMLAIPENPTFKSPPRGSQGKYRDALRIISQVQTRSARFRRGTRRTAKSLRSNRLISQRCEVIFHLVVFGVHRDGKLQGGNTALYKKAAKSSRNKRVISQRCAKFFLQLGVIGLQWLFLFASSPYILDLLMAAKDFTTLVLHVSELQIALPNIPHNSPQSRIALQRAIQRGAPISPSVAVQGISVLQPDSPGVYSSEYGLGVDGLCRVPSVHAAGDQSAGLNQGAARGHVLVKGIWAGLRTHLNRPFSHNRSLKVPGQNKMGKLVEWVEKASFDA